MGHFWTTTQPRHDGCAPNHDGPRTQELARDGKYLDQSCHASSCLIIRFPSAEAEVSNRLTAGSRARVSRQQKTWRRNKTGAICPQTDVRCAWPVSQPRPSPANQDTNGGGRWTGFPIPNTLCDPISADLGTHMDDASRVCCCDGTGTGTGLTAFAQRRRLSPSIPPTAFPVPSPGQRQPVRRDSQDGGNPPGPGRFACVPCLSWLAGGGGMCSHPAKKKKRCCNVPLMRRPLARMAGWQAKDRARGRWATQVVVASGGLHLSPCLKLTDFSCLRRLSPPLGPKTFPIQARLFHRRSFATRQTCSDHGHAGPRPQ